jgi:hypothetical protein
LESENKKSAGRRFLPLEEKRKARCIKMSDKEWEQIQNQAAKKNMSVSKHIRETLLKANS